MFSRNFKFFSLFQMLQLLPGIKSRVSFYIFDEAIISVTRSHNSAGVKTPFSVIIPVINSAGVTSNAGFQQPMPTIRRNNLVIVRTF